MAVFLLIRHGNTDWVDKVIAGRRPEVHLNAEGRGQAEQLPERLTKVPITALYCSPLERALETAAPLADRLNLEVNVCEDLTEVAFGAWTERDIQGLSDVPEWHRFNTFRSGTRIPGGGELMVEVQTRMVAALERLRKQHPGGVIAVVSHADPIKLAVAYYAGMPIDFILRLDIGPASVSMIGVEDWGPRILCVNHRGDLDCR